LKTLDAPGVLIAGNFLSKFVGTRAVCEDLSDRLEGAGWAVVRTSGRRGKVARLADMTSTAWRRRADYDVAQVDVYSGPAFVWAEMVCRVLRAARKPYVLTLHGGNLPNFARRQPRRVARLLSSAHAVTAPSRYLLENMRDYRADLKLLFNALDLSRQSFQERAVARPQLVWVRAFCEIYNPTMAPAVVAELAGEFPDIRLMMVGPDKGDGSLAATQRSAEELGVASRIEFVGRVPSSEVPGQLARGDVFLNTTNFDNTPLSVMEAMAAGLCVVSTDAGGLPYLVRDGHDALLVPVGDTSAMASAVRRILGESDLAVRLSRAAHQTATQFDWGRVLPQWEQLLREAREAHKA
jgi:glycosyltransferase involved in cell wall biosynthesis